MRQDGFENINSLLAAANSHKEKATVKMMLAIGLCVGLLVSPLAMGQTCSGTIYFDPAQGDEGDWSDTTAWRDACGGTGIDVLPPPESHVVICAGKTCNMDLDPSIDEICVESTAVDGVGVLNILATYTLTLHEPSGTSTINGQINLTGDIHIEWDDDADPGSEPWVYTFDGPGSIVGTTNTPGSRKILIDGHTVPQPNILFNSTTIRGALEIGRLDEEVVSLILKGGTVHADTNGTIKIAVSTLEDESAASPSLLKVSSHPNAVLLIDQECPDTLLVPCSNPCLEFTNVEVLTGTLHLPDDQFFFQTRGTLLMERGGIIQTDEMVALFLFQGPCDAN